MKSMKAMIVMKILTNKNIRHFFFASTGIFLAMTILSQLIFFLSSQKFSVLLLVALLLGYGIFAAVFFIYFQNQNKMIEDAVSQIDLFLSGKTDARIDCDKEGELYKLFHSINTLSAVLNAHAENEQQSKIFLKNTISDISHQLKTPLAALNIYNGLLQNEANGDLSSSTVQELSALSEQELDRIESLVQSLLKITRLDAGALKMEKSVVNIFEMMNDIELHFKFRATQENKNLEIYGSEKSTLFCDGEWLSEAISNIVKNAFDHTKSGDTISINWEERAAITRIFIKDNGSGIHPEDIHHIFKRFYRSRFSTDTQGIGLGLSLAKSIVEANGGNITVDSVLEKGTTFTITFLTKL